MADSQPPAFVISLTRAHDRRSQFAAEAAKIGLPYDIFDGVDGAAEFDALMAQTDEAAWHRNMGAPIAAGHLGCYASHVRLWEQIGGGPDDVVLICEDDVTFDTTFPDAMAAALNLADRWDICRFAKIRAKGAIPQTKVGPFTLNAYQGPFTGNACYLIKKPLAARLAQSFWPISRAHDHELNRFFHYDFRLMGIEPFAAHPRDHDESFITGTHMTGVQKFPKYQRLPHYAQKLANYWRRRQWLKRNGLL